MEFLNTITQFIDAHLMGSAVMIGGVLDFALRLTKSDKPLSVLYVIANALKGIGGVMNKGGEFMDKILPQRLKEEDKK